jgi:hypothetical protein
MINKSVWNVVMDDFKFLKVEHILSYLQDKKTLYVQLVAPKYISLFEQQKNNSQTLSTFS